jgi:hypothetical protein
VDLAGCRGARALLAHEHPKRDTADAKSHPSEKLPARLEQVVFE